MVSLMSAAKAYFARPEALLPAAYLLRQLRELGVHSEELHARRCIILAAATMLQTLDQAGESIWRRG